MTASGEKQRGDTELWLADLSAASSALEQIEAATPRLPEVAIQSHADLAIEARRRERRLAHVCLRILLERVLGPGIRRRPFETSAAGKPSIDSPTSTVSFSLAHTTGLALIAVGPGPLGVDLERARKVRMAPARRAPIEAAAVAFASGAPLHGPDEGHDEDTRFLRAWTRLEAVAKANGTGIAPLLERLRPGSDQVPDGLDSLGAPGIRVVAHDISTAPGLFAVIALEAARAPPHLQVLPVTRQALEALLEG